VAVAVDGRTRAAGAEPAQPAAATAELNTMGNLAGLPSVSVPCGFDAEGMPLGLHIAARSWDEQSCLDVAMTSSGRRTTTSSGRSFRAS
jgi:Asp-tRNA(Asn)/Glu-tRNA(Gln) amidotransferase A subunit family amidase